jgi:hypothetical protein
MSSLAQIQEVVAAPVVSVDASSPEAKLARAMKATQAQAAADSTFDTVIERFAGCGCSSSTGINTNLVIAVFAVGIVLASAVMSRRR